MGLLHTCSRYLTAWKFPKHIEREVLVGGGLDVTNRCNLRCTHCYWWRQEHRPDLPDDEMIKFMKRLRTKGVRVIYLLGGEPLLRERICWEAGRIFDFTKIFTNGTLGYPDVNEALYSLSIDGPEEIHDRLRGKGIFKKVIDILDRQDKQIMIHITVCQSNRYHLRKTIEEFIRRPNVGGIYFCFYCPTVGMNPKDNQEFIPLKERDTVVDELVEYRREFGERIFMTERVGYYLKTTGGLSAWNSLEKCVTKRLFEFYAADGKYKYHCAYGKEADCRGCGCSQVPLMHAMKDEDPDTNRMVYLHYWRLNPTLFWIYDTFIDRKGRRS